jgi:hypothetical protein
MTAMPDRAEIEGLRPFLVGAMREARHVLGSGASDAAAKDRALRMLNDALGRLDRVRDARGDDEAGRCGCNELLGGHRDECPKWGESPAARSPQGEDHEAWADRFRRAADEAERRGPSEGVDPLIHAAMVEAYRTQADELSSPPPEYMTEADAHRWVDEHVDPPAARHLAHSLVSSLPRVARVSLSRDGSVAVEDHELRELARSVLEAAYSAPDDHARIERVAEVLRAVIK